MICHFKLCRLSVQALDTVVKNMQHDLMWTEEQPLEIKVNQKPFGRQTGEYPFFGLPLYSHMTTKRGYINCDPKAKLTFDVKRIGVLPW